MTGVSKMTTYVDAEYMAKEIQNLKTLKADDSSFVIACNCIYEMMQHAPSVMIDIRDDYRGRV